MIVITLTKVPRALKGDLTKWYQEIQTGVYVGNVSARIRDLLWDRIMENIGRGEATMVYNAKNELGYQFRTTRRDREVVDFDGIPLMMNLKEAKFPVKHGFSNAAKFHKARVMQRPKKSSQVPVAQRSFAAIDLETTGLDPADDVILSIGAVKKGQSGQMDSFERLVQVAQPVPKKITALTGLTNEVLTAQGVSLAAALQELKLFLGALPIVGYNLRFDETFLTSSLRKAKQADLTNQMIDLMPTVKKVNIFLDNYRLETVLAEYGVENSNPHHALADAQATMKLANQLIENRVLVI